MKPQNGFTLIEVMIVTLILGVLSSIAIPLYKDYIARSQVANTLASLTGIKVGVATYKYDNGTCTGPNNYYDQDITNIVNNSGASIASITVVDNGDTCLIDAQYNNSVALGLRNKHIEYTVNFDTTGASAWSCSSPDIEDKYLPPACK